MSESNDPNHGGREVLAVHPETGAIMCAVSHDTASEEKAAMVRLDAMNAVLWLGAATAERLALALLRFADARRAAERQSYSFPASDRRQ